MNLLEDEDFLRRIKFLYDQTSTVCGFCEILRI